MRLHFLKNYLFHCMVRKLFRVGTHHLLPQLMANHLTSFNKQNINRGNLFFRIKFSVRLATMCLFLAAFHNGLYTLISIRSFRLKEFERCNIFRGFCIKIPEFLTHSLGNVDLKTIYSDPKWGNLGDKKRRCKR